MKCPESFHFGRVLGAPGEPFFILCQLLRSQRVEQYPAPSSSFSELSLAVDDCVRVLVILYRVGPELEHRAELSPAAPRPAAASPQAAAGAEPPGPSAGGRDALT